MNLIKGSENSFGESGTNLEYLPLGHVSRYIKKKIPVLKIYSSNFNPKR
jgi:hypothetical protein